MLTPANVNLRPIQYAGQTLKLVTTKTLDYDKSENYMIPTASCKPC